MLHGLRRVGGSRKYARIGTWHDRRTGDGWAKDRDRTGHRRLGHNRRRRFRPRGYRQLGRGSRKVGTIPTALPETVSPTTGRVAQQSIEARDRGDRATVGANLPVRTAIVSTPAASPPRSPTSSRRSHRRSAQISFTRLGAFRAAWCVTRWIPSSRRRLARVEQVGSGQARAGRDARTNSCRTN